MLIIEKSDGTEAGRWNNLTNQKWPDGATFSGRMKVGDSRTGKDGETYTIFEVLQKTAGSGPRTLGTGPITKVGDEWHQTTTYGAALPPGPKPIVTYDEFEAKFTAGEWSASTDFVYESDLVTGKPKRRALLQGLARAQARNSVDLEDAKTAAFMGALVAGGAVTEARKDIILTP
jgi:hypothetical protein